MLAKAKSAFEHTFHPRLKDQVATHDGTHDAPSTIKPPTPTEVVRYRYHHGTNLGSIFVQEMWLTGSMFAPDSTGISELAAVQGWVKSEGIEKTRARFEQHWQEYVSDADLDWLRDVAHCNGVRLPIGYFTLGPDFCRDTPFGAVGDVYKNAWSAVKALVKRCHDRGIGVLVDLHGLPSGANGGDHSGTDSGAAQLWTSQPDKSLATRCVCYIVHELRCVDGILGVQIVNEAEANASGMYEWYSSVLAEVSKVDSTMPIYISDAWNFGQAVTWVQQKNRVQEYRKNPVVIDAHLYWCFSDDDKRKTPQQITAEVGTRLMELNGKSWSVLDRGAVNAVVGEYSCVLADESWSQSGGVSKDELVQKFGIAQSTYYQRNAAGSFFWTYRMDWMDYSGEWGFKQMNIQQAIKPPISLTFSVVEVQSRIAKAQGQRDDRRGQAYASHCQYWDANDPSDKYEHWRFQLGWDIGFSDAMSFFGMRSQCNLQGGDKIGLLELWTLKRLEESGQVGQYGWEFETGLRQGITGFVEAADV
ncbi:unnamed protein product [Zymoseptoria tritici ST99CH_3D1]|uniref:Glycoside hydrolase family 5 domain-containing protein n=1 Tax=Zymoseptoria tritici (strain ST99CH_3D7) TaxID=1276538 RepID=A0A1X7RU59_ZYMT9|nr:unnamed protein product [Zymoseptoria tritici ST99CH_3D7]SMR53920.1 unnamed protein product [Zymoseptoria tritici ST99CH_3D1]